MTEGIEHCFGIGRRFDGVNAAFPGGLDPENGFAGKRTYLFCEKGRSIVVISGKRDHLAEFLDGVRIFSFKNALAKFAGGPEFHLLKKQTVLNAHKILAADIKKTAVFFPDFLFGILVEFFLKSHCPSSLLADLEKDFSAFLMLAAVGNKKGVVLRYSGYPEKLFGRVTLS